MTRRRQALVVVPTPDMSESLAAWLGASEYATTVVRDYGTARSEIDLSPPDLLVAEIKLGSYNGLQLAIRLRSRRLHTPVVLIGHADPVLKAEATRHQAAYLTPPLSEDVLLATIRRQGEDYRPSRRSPRKRVPMLDAIVDSVHARIVDVSYEGLRLEVTDPGGPAIPPYFMVQIPTFNLTCRAQRVWTSPSPDESGLSCGATLVGEDPANAVAWRALVDAVPGWTLLAN